MTRCVRPDGSHYGTAGKCRKGTEDAYKDWKRLAEGNMGTIDVSPDGTRVVKKLKEGREWGPHEVELGKKMGTLGFSPRVYSAGPDHIEMEIAKGKPLWAGYKQGEDEPVMNAAQAKQAGKAIYALHKMGFYHGDMHSQQFLADGDKVKMLDYGLSKPISEEPRKAIQDLNKIAKLVNFDNPELDGNPYFRLVRKYRKLYSEVKKPDDQNAVARQYMEELQQL